ncbi:hypothetical protein TSUD_173590 [Trifolium subterraneum]|nr:hypothetical protein TSUD_173590 [Trifolium subterraneum]
MAEKDIISTLPDEILCHILSFLQTKEADATTILSKRWKHLWRSVTTLRIHAKVETLNSHSAFIHFVNSVLFSRDPALPIKTFQLHFMYGYPHASSLKNWVNFVVQRGVKCLNLNTALYRYPKLPINVLTCKTLVVLKLSGFRVEKGCYDILLPSLKSCHLEFVRFPKSRDFIMFVTGCPILQELYTYEVDFDRGESFTRKDQWKSFLLSNLTRTDINFYLCLFPLEAVQNLQYVRFNYHQKHYRNDLIPTFHNLTLLELSCYDYNKELLLDILNHCPKLRRLDLDDEVGAKDEEVCARKNDKTNWIFPDVVPQCLSLYLKTCNLFHFGGLHGELMLASYILKNASVLQTMNIGNGGKRKRAIKRKLSAVPMASAMCKLTIHNGSDGALWFSEIMMCKSWLNVKIKAFGCDITHRQMVLEDASGYRGFMVSCVWRLGTGWRELARLRDGGDGLGGGWFGEHVVKKDGDNRGGVGVAPTVEGVGGGDVEGVLGLTTSSFSAGSLFR